MINNRVLISKNENAKRYYEQFIEAEKKVKGLCIAAEANCKNVDKKKRYAVANIHIF